MQTLRIGFQAGWTPEQVERSLPQIDISATLADALTAPDGSRLRAGGERASELLATDHTLGATASGDLVVVYDPDSGSSRLALVESTRWLPETLGARQISLNSGQSDRGQILSAREVAACSPIPQADLSVCVQTQFPLMSRAAIIDLVIYALLLLGPALAILGLFRLFEQRRAESEAFEGEATRAGRILKTVLHQSRAGFWSWDSSTETFQFSAEASHLIGMQGEVEISKDEFLSLVHSEQMNALEQSLETLRERGFLRQVFANKDKSVWIDMRAEPDEDGGALNGVLRDVTETKVAIARTRQAENRLRSALEGFSGPFALWDRRKRLIYWNRAFIHVFGLEPTVRAGMGYDTVMLSQAANILERRQNDRDDKAEIIKIRDGEWYKIIERTTQSGGMITMGMDVSSDVRN